MSKAVLYDSEQLFNGLWLTGSPENMPKGALRRAKGLHHLRTTTLRSRWGSTLIHSLAAHSLFRFNDVRFQGAGTVLHRNGVSILTGLDGSRLAFVKMPPTVDVDLTVTPIADYLFVTGGGLVRKVDSAGAVTNWGIAAPPDGFTATKVAQKSKLIDAFESAASWTGASATLADEATIKQEGTNAMKMTVVKSTVGTATKSVPLSLNIFGMGEDSPEEDYISVWVRVDNPTNVESIQIQFDISTGDFAADIYTRVIPVTEEIIPQLQIKGQAGGIGSLPQVVGNERLFVREADGRLIPVDDSTKIVNRLGQTTITTSQNSWIRLRIPKSTFQKSGTSSNDWANVTAVRLIVKTNSRGTAIVYWDDLKMIGGGGGLMGVYKYKVTFKNTATGSRSNANPTEVEVEEVERQSINLANLPISSDSQVNQREIWRTVGNGTLFFRVGTVDDNTTTTFTDDVADYYGLDSRASAEVMENLELPTDNTPPEATYDDAFGPFANRMWWTRDSVIGTKGRVYYSSANRAESVQGFLQVTNDDDPTQKGIIWNEAAYVFTEAKVFQIVGTTEPFFAREVYGVPGTTNPHTIKATPYGIVYQAADGVRVFDGATSRLAAFDGVNVIFHGEAASGISPFEGVVAAYGTDEYVISDTQTTLALDMQRGGWREVGPPATALYYEEDTGLMIASFSGKVVILEDENILTDDGVAIPFDVETKGVRTDESQIGVVQFVFIDIDTSGQFLTPTLTIDGATVTLADFSTTSREVIEYAIGRSARVVSLRLEGDVSDRIEIFEISADVYVPAGKTLLAGEEAPQP